MTPETLIPLPDTQGWVKLYRALFASKVWREIPALHRLVGLPLLAAVGHRDEDYWNGRETIRLKAGEFVTSYDKIAGSIVGGVTKDIVRGALSNLEKIGFLTKRRSTVSKPNSPTTNPTKWAGRGIIVSICNWSAYQSNGAADPTTSPTIGPTSRPLRAHFEPTNQEVKKLRSTYEEISLKCADPRRLSLREALNIFRGLYQTEPDAFTQDQLDVARTRFTPAAYFEGLKAFHAASPTASDLRNALAEDPSAVFGGSRR